MMSNKIFKSCVGFKNKNYPFQKLSFMLNDKDNKYEIPIYQRNYVWSDNKYKYLVKNLIDDVFYDFKNNNETFLNVIYVSSSNQIIDGQQRLLTFGLIKRILIDDFSHLYKTENPKMNIAVNLFGSSNDSVRKNYYICQYISKNVKTIPEEIKDFVSYIKDQIELNLNDLDFEKNEWENFARYIDNNVKCLLIKITEESGYSVFEKLNSSNVKLDFFEICESYLIDRINNLDDKDIRKKFEIFYKEFQSLDKNDKNLFFENIIQILLKSVEHKANNSGVYILFNKFKTIIKTDEELKFMVLYLKTYLKLYLKAKNQSTSRSFFWIYSYFVDFNFIFLLAILENIENLTYKKDIEQICFCWLFKSWLFSKPIKTLKNTIKEVIWSTFTFKEGEIIFQPSNYNMFMGKIKKYIDKISNEKMDYHALITYLNSKRRKEELLFFYSCNTNNLSNKTLTLNTINEFNEKYEIDHIIALKNDDEESLYGEENITNKILIDKGLNKECGNTNFAKKIIKYETHTLSEKNNSVKTEMTFFINNKEKAIKKIFQERKEYLIKKFEDTYRSLINMKIEKEYDN